MSFNFVVDCIVKGKAYPALAQHQAEPYTPAWQQFIKHYPYTVPCELIEYCKEHNVAYNLYTIDDYPNNSYYLIHLGFFNFDIDYFGLLSVRVRDAVREGNLTILFYYHEGDNPFRIKERLDNLCLIWNLPDSAYKFISGNTAAELITGFVYFADHELLYYNLNKLDKKILENPNTKMKVFTALSRTHKWWRATALADLHRQSLLDNSYWSYNTEIVIDDCIEDCPIEIDTLNIRSYLNNFIDGGPYTTADRLSAKDHNNHALTVKEHYTNSYCNIIFETLYDADQSGGTFLTEKTFKPIKHGQPFVMVGPKGSLAILRSLGYRTFDNYIDNSYDLIENNTKRWLCIQKTITAIKNSDLPRWRESCQADVEHNQALFLSSKANRLNNLLTKLQTL